jgi:hypothetical protein
MQAAARQAETISEKKSPAGAGLGQSSEMHDRGTLGAPPIHYLLGIGFPPGVPSGTRSGFTAPVVPPFAPYGLPAPGTATGA